jgi:hypothetical protein
MTGWWVTSLNPATSTTQSSQTARFQDDPQSGAFCGDLRPFISWILVSVGLPAPERRFLASRLRVPKFRSRRLGLEPAVLGQSRLRCGFSTAVIRFRSTTVQKGAQNVTCLPAIPMHVTSCAARFLDFMSIVSSNLYTAACFAFSQIANFSASDFASPTIASTELEFFHKLIVSIIRNDLNY